MISEREKEAMPRKVQKKAKTIFRYLLLPMFILVLVEVLIQLGSPYIGGMYERLDQNAKDILRQKVEARAGYLQSEMLQNWGDLTELTGYINQEVGRLVHQGEIDFDRLDEGSVAAAPLIMDIIDKLVEVMRTKRVTGIYVIFSTGDLTGDLRDKPGVYLRNLEPLSRGSAENADLLLERAPMVVSEEYNIAMDKSWRPQFEFAKRNIEYYDFFYKPYQAAMNNTQGYTSEQMGYWGEAYALDGSKMKTITYSVPLISSAGTVYGVAGIDISLNYINKLMPHSELMDSAPASYTLAVMEAGQERVRNTFSNGAALSGNSGEEFELERVGEDCYISGTNRMLYTAPVSLKIYDRDSPYGRDNWMILGTVRSAELFAFSEKMRGITMLAVFITLAAGIAVSIAGSRVISIPVERLSRSVEQAGYRKEENIERTGIVELDALAEEIEKLNRRTREYAQKFNNILKGSTIRIAGFEYDSRRKELFLSDNFFGVYGDHKTKTENLDAQQFKNIMKKYEGYITDVDYGKSEHLYKIPLEDDYIYVNLKIFEKEGVYTGVAEDVTNTIVEKRILEYERDHDTLTGLLNRRAFRRKVKDLFKAGGRVMKTAVLVMMDLDNLKYVNDNFGHEAGDNYILKAAECMKTLDGNRAVISRISGDEFFLFFYGRETEEEIRDILDRLEAVFKDVQMKLPNEETYPVRASAGAAWYPKDTQSFEVIQKYADYAMYQAKRSGKNRYVDFSRDDYERHSVYDTEKEELNTLIKEGAVSFFFQPIVDCRDGSIFGYEALMRSMMPTLKNPLDILNVAKQEGRLYEIELLTWTHALETYANCIRDGEIKSGSKVFINSIPNQAISAEEMQKLEDKYRPYLSNVVLEVTEGERMEEELHIRKRRRMDKWKAEIAVDDYGSGYNGGQTLLKISPKYIKIDMEMIRDIDTDRDKCGLVETITDYAHERDMKVIAEGVETIGELKQLIRLRLDYAQGYLLDKPQQRPRAVPEDIVKLIQINYKEIWN